MRTIKHCIRCRREFLFDETNRELTAKESLDILEMSLLGLIEIEYDNIVCDECRYIIGDEVSDYLLKIFND
jgi:DNA-directed RNA polymerase subunit RPC12/RpoP